MKILITGVHGFVGINLVEALSKEHTLYGLDIIAPEKEGVVKTFSWDDLGEGWQEVQGSRVQGKIPDIDAIIHLAGKAHDVKSDERGQKEEYMRINCGLTQKIFDWYLAHPTAKKFIQFSTVKSAADRVEGDFLTEDVVPAPVGPYGESKNAAERYILDQFKDYSIKLKDSLNSSKVQESSSIQSTTKNTENYGLTTDPKLLTLNYQLPAKQVYILRPCLIHGPGNNKGNLNLLYNMVRKGIPWPLGAFENRRSFTSIGNLQEVIKGLLTKDVASGIYNMGDDETLSTNELIEMICSALGKKAYIWNIPRGLMNGLAKIGDVLHLPLNSQRMQKLTENYVVSNAKIKAALGMKEMPVRAKDGMKETIKSFAKKS